MRIVGGRFRGAALATPKSRATRPTSDRLREAIFNILEHRYSDAVTGARVIDLFAGTGAMGLEALSRGADYCVFVDNAADSRGLIRENIERLGLTGVTRVFRRDARRLGSAKSTESYDLMFVDPPYGMNYGEPAIAGAIEGGWLRPGALIVLEESTRAETKLPDGVRIDDRREYSQTTLVFATVDA